MKPSQHPNLGRVVAEVTAAAVSLNDDPMNDYAGFTPDPTPALEEIVKREGFENFRHFSAVVSDRTSARWAYFNLPF